jgi:hypothetical protein
MCAREYQCTYSYYLYKYIGRYFLEVGSCMIRNCKFETKCCKMLTIFFNWAFQMTRNLKISAAVRVGSVVVAAIIASSLRLSLSWWYHWQAYVCYLLYSRVRLGAEGPSRWPTLNFNHLPVASSRLSRCTANSFFFFFFNSS